ncbi:MAG: hypothetical protein JJ875_17565, partial [Roseibium sp.]|nr:hypothetical protein [Roseibium sp.]
NATIDRDWRPTAFAAWAAGSIVAVIVEFYAPQFSTAISAGLAGGVAYLLFNRMPEAARAGA